MLSLALRIKEDAEQAGLSPPLALLKEGTSRYIMSLLPSLSNNSLTVATTVLLVVMNPKVAREVAFMRR